MSLEQVIGEVRRDGDMRAQAIVAEARKEAHAIIESARAQAKQVEAARMAAAEKEATAVTSQAASRAESESRKLNLSAEAELRNELKATVVKGLAEIPAKTREKHLKSLLAKAHSIIPKGTVWGSSQDTAFLAGQKTYKHAGSLPIAGGIVVESEDGMNRLDLTYETLLDEAWRDVLKAEVGLFH